MKPRTPLCEFALRLDQVHPGIEVVVFDTENKIYGEATDLERKLIQVDTFGQFLTTPYVDENGQLVVSLKGYATHYFDSIRYTDSLGLHPRVEWDGWCTHHGYARLSAMFSARPVHAGSHCPNIYKELSWSPWFVVKLKDAHRVLGCQPHETRELLMTVVRERYEREEEEYQYYLNESQHYDE